MNKPLGPLGSAASCVGRVARRLVLTLGVSVLLIGTLLTLAASAPAQARTPRIKGPSAPVSVYAAPINGGTTISWGAPLSDGGSPITGYLVTAERGNACSTSGAKTCTIGGLKNGKTYIVTVRATNAIGTGKVARTTVTAGQGPNCLNLSPGANLKYCKYKGANLQGLDLAGANLYGASLFGANLKGANLSQANLDIADLNYAILTDTNLSGTLLPSGFGDDYMDYVVSGGVIGASMSYPWAVINGYLVGPLANLEGANLAGGNFSAGVLLLGTDLTDANLTNAHLIGADAIGTIFAGANFTGANLVEMNHANEGDYSDVIWSNTICPDGTNSNNDRKTCVHNGA